MIEYVKFSSSSHRNFHAHAGINKLISFAKDTPDIKLAALFIIKPHKNHAPENVKYSQSKLYSRVNTSFNFGSFCVSSGILFAKKMQ